MTSEPVRNPKLDRLLTPQNAALVLIDYQPPQVNTVASMDRPTLVRNVVALAKIGMLYGLPVVLSTVNVEPGVNPDTIPPLREVLHDDVASIDRTTINSWEDENFVAAVKATGRRKLVMAALWTEACLAFPTLDALREGYEVFPVTDAVGGTSREAHEAGMARMIQAGAQPTSVNQLLCELQRDWARKQTVPGMLEIATSHGSTFGLYESFGRAPPGRAREPVAPRH